MLTGSSTLTFRPYEKKDIDSILQLWERHSDFGTISKATFYQWFVDTPFEPCEVIVAENEDGLLIGQMIFMPSRVIVNGRLTKALKVAAPIIHNDFKLTFTDLTDNPIWGMYFLGVKQALEKKFSLIYQFPARGWLRIINVVNEKEKRWITDTYKTWAVPLNNTSGNTFHSDGTYAVLHSSFSKEYDELWEEAKVQLPVHCGIERKKEWLKYRLGDHCTIEVRSEKTKSLIGYCSIKKKSGLVVDLFARNTSDLTLVFQQSCRYLNSDEGKKIIQTETLTGMYTNIMETVLSKIGCDFPNYEFAFACHNLDHEIQMTDFASSRWYLTPDV